MENWVVAVDQTVGYGCFALASYEGGTVLRIGLAPESDVPAYIMLGDEDWKSLEYGKEYELTIQFDTLDPWTGTATGVSFGSDEFVFLMISFDNSDLVLEFMKRHQMSVKYQNNNIATLSLAGSYRAFVEVLACQDQMMSAGQPQQRVDPFDSEGSTPNSDPFSQ